MKFWVGEWNFNISWNRTPQNFSLGFPSHKRNAKSKKIQEKQTKIPPQNTALSSAKQIFPLD